MDWFETEKGEFIRIDHIVKVALGVGSKFQSNSPGWLLMGASGILATINQADYERLALRLRGETGSAEDNSTRPYLRHRRNSRLVRVYL